MCTLIPDISTTYLHLNKVLKFEYQIHFDITDYNIMLLNQGITASKFFCDSRASLCMLPNFYDRFANFHVYHIVEDDTLDFF